MLIHKLTTVNVMYLDPALLAEDTRSKVNVVEDHHHRNRLPRALNPQHLCEVNQRAIPDRPSVPVARDASQDDFSFTQSTTDDLDATQQIPTPPGELSGSATKLRSYPFKFQEIIEQAKQLAQCSTAEDPFPGRTWFVDEKSAEYIVEAIAEHEAKHVYIPPGKSCTPR